MANFLDKRLEEQRASGRWRELPGRPTGVDFWSNDYLGLARARVRGEDARSDAGANSATGSRLISGDYPELTTLENRIAAYHEQPAALFFPSGYVANLALFSALPRRGDHVFYDELMHASVRDGLRLSAARAFRFAHNDAADLARRLAERPAPGQSFVVTESRFSMDGDRAPLQELAAVARAAGAHLIVDEAHAAGLDGVGGRGLVHAVGLHVQALATVVTYGKAFGTHGAAVLGPPALRALLVNLARPLIYTTAPPPEQVATVGRAYDRLAAEHEARSAALATVIDYFRASSAGLSGVTVQEGPIQVIPLPGNGVVMAAETACRRAGLLVKGIRSPTVAVGAERLRVCLHAHNTPNEVDRLVDVLAALPKLIPAI